MKKIFLIVGARPNFMKIAPVYREMQKMPEILQPVLIHTGQHYDTNMSDDFFRDLRLPKPNFSLGVGGGSHARQTAEVMVKMEEICQSESPDWVVVVGDVNSTMAATLAAAKLGIPVAHIEAGLRSRDRAMPEEINRVVTDALSDLLLTPSLDANQNLAEEGVPDHRVVFVGNVMIDSLVDMMPQIEDIVPPIAGKYAVVTMHRPSNVDNCHDLKQIVNRLFDVAAVIPIVFPVHPRTLAALEKCSLISEIELHKNIQLFKPQGYKTFMGWLKKSSMAITDSGGLQEETTFLGVPCLTLRENTERPITVSQGTNQLVTLENLMDKVGDILSGNFTSKNQKPEYWDGRSAQRIVKALLATTP